MDLSELLASGVVLEVLLEHVLCHLLRPGPVDFEHLVRVWVVGVEAPELTLSIPEQYEEVWAITGVNLVKDSHPSFLVHRPREDRMLQAVHDDRPV